MLKTRKIANKRIDKHSEKKVKVSKDIILTDEQIAAKRIVKHHPKANKALAKKIMKYLTANQP